MRTPSKSTLPIEPLGTALGTARGVALTARDKGLELLDSEAAQELLRKGQHVAIVARDRGAELLESDAAQELVRRSRDVVSAAKGDLVPKPTKSRRPVALLLFAAGSAAGIAAAVVSKRMSTQTPEVISGAYEDPAAQFPKKGGVIDLTSVAAEEGVTPTSVEDAVQVGDVELGTATKLTTPPAGSATGGETAPTKSAPAKRSAPKASAAGTSTANGSTTP